MYYSSLRTAAARKWVGFLKVGLTNQLGYNDTILPVMKGSFNFAFCFYVSITRIRTSEKVEFLSLGSIIKYQSPPMVVNNVVLLRFLPLIYCIERLNFH